MADGRTREGRRERAEAEDARRKQRQDRADRAAAHWGEGDGPTRQRTAMLIAAYLLDDARPFPDKDEELADWLRRARPEHARAVATGVAVLALRAGFSDAWDALAAVDAMDVEEAGDSYDRDLFSWAPESEWLVD